MTLFPKVSSMLKIDLNRLLVKAKKTKNIAQFSSIGFIFCSILSVPATLNGDVISKPQFEALQHAMKQLEGKFSTAMRDKADLLDQTEQLEHIILQLQGETDTIG